jgi:outer membrane protein assembly factor BamB
MRAFFGVGFGVTVGCLMLAGLAIAEDWPSFRGTDRSGVYRGGKLLSRWPDAGPTLLWENRGAGRGYATVAVAGGRLFTLGDGVSTQADADEYLSCFDEQTGKPIWQVKTGPAWNQGRESWQSSRSTPTVDGDRVFVITPFGQLICCQVSDGTPIWQVHLMDDLGGVKADSWGYSESPLVDGDRVIVTPGGPQATVVALDKRTGARLWTCQRAEDKGAGHACVVISQVQGRRIYVQNTANGPIGIDPDSGTLLWEHPLPPPVAFIPTPIIKDDLVFSVGGYGLGGVLLRQRPGGDGSVAVEEVYPVNSDLSNKHGGVVLVGDHLYFGAEDRNVLMCVELTSGQTAWRQRGPGRDSVAVTATPEQIFFRFADGTMAMVAADPGEYRLLGQFTIPGSGDRPSWAHPSLANGRLYLREGDTILCYDLGGS